MLRLVCVTTLLNSFLLSAGLIAGSTHVRTHDEFLALLRGTWEHNTWDNRTTITFRSDRFIIFDHQQANYLLEGATLRVQLDDSSVECQLALWQNTLSLTSAHGSTVRYARDEPGDAEQALTGKFYPTGNTRAALEWVEFDGDHTCQCMSYGVNRIASLDSSDDRREIGAKFETWTGVYRIDGDVLYCSYPDGTTDRSTIERRSGEQIEELIYEGEQLRIEKDEPPPPILVYFPEPIPQPIPIPIPLPYPPACPPGPDGGHHYDPPCSPSPIESSSSTTSVAPPPRHGPLRDIGSTRGGKPE